MMLAKLKHNSISNYCKIEAPLDNEGSEHLVTREGGIITLKQVTGKLSASVEESDKAIKSLTDAIYSMLKKPGRRVQLSYSRRPDLESRAQNQYKHIFKTRAKNIKLQLDDLIDERCDKMSNLAVKENMLLAMETLPHCLSKAALKAAQKNVVAKLKSEGSAQTGQNAALVLDDIVAQHQSFCNTLTDLFKHNKIHTNELTAGQMLNLLRLECVPNLTSNDWQPIFNNDKLSAHAFDSNFNNDLSFAHAPALYQQLVPEDIVITNNRVFIDGCYTDTFQVNTIQQNPASFKYFLELLGNEQNTLPFRILFTIESGSEFVTKKLNSQIKWARLFHQVNDESKIIGQACQNLIAEYNEGEAVCFCAINVVTWATDEETLQRQKEFLWHTVQSWGGQSCIANKGDPFQNYFESLPGFTESYFTSKSWVTMKPESQINPQIVRLRDFVKQLPLFETGSPWRVGCEQYITKRSTVHPHQPLEGQDYDASILLGSSGSGKSLFSHYKNTSYFIASNSERIPRLAIFDIGFSGKHFIELIQSFMNDEDKHLVQHIKAVNNTTCAINLLEPRFGCRKPLRVDNSSVVNILCQALVPELNKTNPDFEGFIESLLEHTYEEYGYDDNYTNKYNENRDSTIDNALNKIGYTPQNNTTSWWEIADVLFQAGLTVEAGLAHCYAAPTIQDTVKVLARATSLREEYKKALSPNQHEPLVDFVSRRLTHVAKKYPLFTSVSRLSVSNARVICVDLDEVAPKDNESQTSLMYMAFYYYLTRDFNLTEKFEDISDVIPALYHNHYKTLIEQEKGVKKRIVLDEFHRASSSPYMRAQISKEILEGRKHNKQLCLSSQHISHFNQSELQMFTNIFLSDNNNVAEIKNLLKLSDEVEKAAMKHLVGIHDGKSSLLHIAKVKGINERVTSCLYLPLGPCEIWGYTTTPSDVLLRNQLIKFLGDDATLALKLLSKKFPSGSAVKVIKQQSDLHPELEDPDIIKKLIEHMIEENQYGL